jgi:V/A-type H+-transporting ATPase subunit B
MSRGAELEYRGLAALRGPLGFVTGVSRASYREHVEVIGPDGRVRVGRVVGVSGESAVIEIFSGTDGLPLAATRVRFRGAPLEIGVGPELVGRVFDGLGRPRDGLPPAAAVERRAIEGLPINPVRRELPREFLETGLSAIDGLNTLVLGQKLPIFTESGLPHDALAMQIVRQARVPGGGEFAIVFAALGLPRETALRYLDDFRTTGALSRVVAFFNFADDPAPERLITPRCALTAAEYLAFDRGLHVLVIFNDVTNYGEALREVASAGGEVPGRKGYPGYLYSDLASIFERAGRVRGRPGSLTQIPIVTLPSGDVTHPIPDLTGYITEGQVVLEGALDRRGVYPPVDVLPSLSRLMAAGIGEGRTRDDHPALARQLYVACARAGRARSLESIIGREELSDLERAYLDFGEKFERGFLTQGAEERRTVSETLELAWAAIGSLPDSELGRLPAALREKRRSATVVP